MGFLSSAPAEPKALSQKTRERRMTARKRKYLAYLESGHWKSLRYAARVRDGHKCVLCGSPKSLQGHHKRYRKDLRLCTVDDVETLCEKCHSKHHKDRLKERRENRKIRREVRESFKSSSAFLIAMFDAK